MLYLLLIKVGYYTKEDLNAGILHTPSNSMEFKDFRVPDSHLDPYNFRLHPKGIAGTPMSRTSSMSSVSSHEIEKRNHSSTLFQTSPNITVFLNSNSRSNA
jgi:hypothetical protein